MKNPQRNAVYAILETMERISRGADVGATPSSGHAEAAKESRPRPPVREVLVDREHLLRLRNEVRRELMSLRAELGQMLTERECYLALFPVVVCLDELVQTRYSSSDQTSWSMLQKEFFNVDQGGELFYATLDDVLDSGPRSSIIIEIFYFCLSVGFRGKYSGDEDKVASYMRKLRSKFEEAAAHAAPEAEETPAAAGIIRPMRTHVWWYYVASAIAVLLVYFALRSLASGDRMQAQGSNGPRDVPARSAADRPTPRSAARDVQSVAVERQEEFAWDS
jgi:type IV/VI secretion system ImpK/VasF family protein